MNALLALRPCNRGRLRSVRHCLVSHQCRCVLQRLSVADFKRPCLKPLGVHFRHPCLACPSRCIDPLHFYNLLKSTSTASPRTTTLASLVKGEVLSPEKIRATTGGIASPPSLTCTNPPKPALSPSLFVMLTSVCTNMFSHPHYPTKTANTLASPRKRGGGTADTNFSLAVQYSDSPAFTILKLFRAVTVGIVSP